MGPSSPVAAAPDVEGSSGGATAATAATSAAGVDDAAAAAAEAEAKMARLDMVCTLYYNVL